MKRLLTLYLFLVLTSSYIVNGQIELTHEQSVLREIYMELIEINTTNSEGDTKMTADLMAKYLIDAGFPLEDVKVFNPHPRKGNLVARLQGTGKLKPLLLLAHMDVVEVNKEEWIYDPFKLTEIDGYFYGRGTYDDKSMAAIFIANLILFKENGIVPDRDIIVCITTDEEGGGYNGVKWLLENHPQMIKAEYCINEGGIGILKDGKNHLLEVQVSEKVYQNYKLYVEGKGGHSSVPSDNSAIDHLANAVTQLSKYDFPVNLNDGSRAFFEIMSDIETGQTSSDMKSLTSNNPDIAAINRLSKIRKYNAIMRTTCVTTILEAGYAPNAIPSSATATVNCRILPTESPDDVLATLDSIIGNDKIKISPLNTAFLSPPSLLYPEIVSAIKKVTDEVWPGVQIIPTMSPWSGDAKYIRAAGVPVYGVNGLFGGGGIHNKDERIGVKNLYEGQQFLYELSLELSIAK